MELNQKILSDMAVIGKDNNYIVYPNGDVFNIKLGRFMTNNIHTQGYIMINIDGQLRYAHRLVAEAYCKKPKGCDVVNHIDSNVQNNNADNLEWCTTQHNVEHSSAKHFKLRDNFGRLIIGFNISNFCRNYNLDSGHICKVLSGERKSHKGWTAA